MPDSHNAGEFGAFLIAAPHIYSLTLEELALHKTDGHLDVNTVREGAILICPVKVPGGGIYMGDMHALQGDGEIAGHTCDVAGTVTLEVSVIKDVKIVRHGVMHRRRCNGVCRQWSLSNAENHGQKIKSAIVSKTDNLVKARRLHWLYRQNIARPHVVLKDVRLIQANNEVTDVRTSVSY